MDLEQLFVDNKEKSLYGRYLTLESIEPLLEKMNTIINYRLLEN
jgi:hypothetical protein